MATLLQICFLLFFCLISHFQTVFGRVEETLVRVELSEIGDRKIVTMVNSDQIVNFLLESDGKIVDCSVTRMRPHLVKMVRFEIEYTLSKAEKLLEPLDVSWYARRCTKTLRDLNRNGNRTDPKVAEILDRQILNKAVQGSRFCTRKAPTWNAELTFDNLISVDKCCQNLQTCSSPIEPFYYRRGVLNVWFQLIFSCECVQSFKECLESDSSKESAEVFRLFFDVLDLKCYDLEKSVNCNHYSTWFDKCEEAVEDETFAIRDFQNI